jgi:hypothetical protein
MGGPDVSAGLPVSPQGPDHIFISSRGDEMVGVWSLRILDATFSRGFQSFLLIFRISRIVTAVHVSGQPKSCLPNVDGE